MSEFSTIALISRPSGKSVIKAVQALSQHLQAAGYTLLFDKPSAAHLQLAEHSKMSEIAKQADLAIAIGGDGTLLNAARVLGRHGVPMLGVNLGRLGFLVDVSSENMTQPVDDVLAGHFIQEQRLMLKAWVERDNEVLQSFVAFNDMVLHTRELPRMLEFNTSVDGSLINHHRADGFIVATPTGSTAYSLSGGGPILHPSLSAIALVPICPHTLSDRPIVVSGDSRIEITLPADRAITPALLSADGQEHAKLEAGDRIIVERAAWKVRLLHPETYDYFDVLRSKLHWGSVPER